MEKLVKVVFGLTIAKYAPVIPPFLLLLPSHLNRFTPGYPLLPPWQHSISLHDLLYQDSPPVWWRLTYPSSPIISKALVGWAKTLWNRLLVALGSILTSTSQVGDGAGNDDEGGGAQVCNNDCNVDSDESHGAGTVYSYVDKGSNEESAERPNRANAF